MDCPRCRTPLDSHQAARLVLHGCTTCGGIWLDADASQRVVESIDPNVIAAADQEAMSARVRPNQDAPAPCPVCQRALDRMPIEQARVVVDACPGHGIWFDKDELQIVVRAVAPQRNTPVPMAPNAQVPPQTPMQAQPMPNAGAPMPMPNAGAPMPMPSPSPSAPTPSYDANPAAKFFSPTNETPAPVGAPGSPMPMGGAPMGQPMPQQPAPIGGAPPAAAFFTNDLGQGGGAPMPQQPGAPGSGWTAGKTALAVGGGVAAVAGVAYLATHTGVGRELVQDVEHAFGGGNNPAQQQYQQQQYQQQQYPQQQPWNHSPQQPGGLAALGGVLSRLF